MKAASRIVATIKGRNERRKIKKIIAKAYAKKVRSLAAILIVVG
jgi:hypothetical protein